MSELSQEFQKSENLERVLSRINGSIESLELYDCKELNYPTLLIFGCPRSGSTLLMQWLASTGAFGYPSNLIARFYGNPAFGCEVQKALVDHDKGNQLRLGEQAGEFKSSLGRTQGVMAPSEFWYYWRRYFKFTEVQMLDEDDLESVDAASFVRGLAGMERALGKPLALKGMLLNWHIEYLSKICFKFFFAHISRDLFYVAQSILESRERYSGSREGWWSFKPPGYQDWLALSPIEQVAAQAVYTHKAVEEGISCLPEERKMHIAYAQLCSDPQSVFDELTHKYAQLGCTIKVGRDGWNTFDAREEVRLESTDEKALRDAIDKFSASE